MSMMTRESVSQPGNAPEKPNSQVTAEAEDKLLDASRDAWVRRRIAAVAYAHAVGLTMTRATQLLGISRTTVDKDLQTARDEGIVAATAGVLTARTVETPIQPVITYVCHVCHGQIGRGDGAVSCSYAAIRAATAADVEARSRQTAITIGEAIEASRARWLPTHNACVEALPEPEQDGYYIDVEQIDTPARLLAWQNHLWGKRWFPLTEWDLFLADQVIPGLLRRGSSPAGR